MKKVKYIIPVIISILIASCGGEVRNPAEISGALTPGEKPENAVVKNIDADKTTVAWIGSKMVGSAHDGKIGVKSGELYLVDDVLVGGKIVIDMTKIVVLDIENPAMNARLKGHLESDDFFSVEKFPEAHFDMAQISQIEAAADGLPNFQIKGNLTIKGITHGIFFPAYVKVQDGKLTAKADFSFDRSLFDVRFGSGKFFENLGDNLINDEIRVGLDVVAE
ncbi:MAG: YceI family protein [Bacteroidetes bacterium]|nr:YceI family protein [Bacteroidota bacterium]